MYTRLCWVSDTTCSVLFNLNIIYQPQSTGTFVVPNTVCLVCCHNGVDGVPSCACIRLPESFCFGSGRWSFPIFALFVLRQPNTISYRIIYFPLIFLSQSRTGTANPRPCGKFDIFRMCVEREDACLPATGTSQHRRLNSINRTIHSTTV